VSFTIGGPATPPIKVKFPVGPDSDGTVGTPYDAWFTATGGAGGYTFSITAGSLPAGLSLNTATGEITGTPTTAVDRPAARLTVTVVDVYGNSDSATGSITIHPLPPP
jgi:hypothetical protein